MSSDGACGIFLLSVDTWVTQETVEWLRINETPVLLMNAEVSGGVNVAELNELNHVSQKEAARIINSDSTRELRLMTNGEAAYAWLREECPNSSAVRMLDACSNKKTFRALTRSAFPELRTLHCSRTMTDAELALLVEELRQPGTAWILKPVVGFCAQGVVRLGEFRAGENDAAFSVAGLRAALTAPAGEHGLLIETYLQGEQYTADGYFDSNGDVHVITVSRAPKSNAEDIREVLLATDLKVLRKERPICATLMRKIQDAATGSGDKFFRNFPFMVEYRVDARSGLAFPIEVNAFRHEGKSPAYARLIHAIPLYDFFFRERSFHEDLLTPEVREQQLVAGMIFARRPTDATLALDFDAWNASIQAMTASSTPTSARSSVFHSTASENSFVGWSRAHFDSWETLLGVLELGWDAKFAVQTTDAGNRRQSVVRTVA